MWWFRTSILITLVILMSSGCCKQVELALPKPPSKAEVVRTDRGAVASPNYDSIIRRRTILQGLGVESDKLAEAVVYQYGGPETRTRCVSEACAHVPWFDGIRYECTCNGWATDIMQHGFYIVMYGPPDIPADQVQQIKDSCFVSAVAVGALALTVDTAFQALTSHRPAMEATLRACVAATSTLGGAAVPGFRLEVEERKFW